MDPDTEINLNNLSESDRQEIQQFVQRSSNQANVSEVVNNITQTCWEKCIQNPITSGTLSKGEEACATNCVARWFDAQTAVVKAVTNQKSSSF